jgi:hypothetical protein
MGSMSAQALHLACSKCTLLTYLLIYLLTHLLTYLLTPWSRVLLEKLTGFQLAKKYPAFYGTRSFITAVTSAHQLSLSCASSIQSIPPHPTSWRFKIVLSSHLRLGLPNGFLPLEFPTKFLYTTPRATCRPQPFILIAFITRTILVEEFRPLSSSLCSFLHSPVTSSLLGQICFSTPFSQTPSACVPTLMWATKFYNHTK